MESEEQSLKEEAKQPLLIKGKSDFDVHSSSNTINNSVLGNTDAEFVIDVEPNT